VEFKKGDIVVLSEYARSVLGRSLKYIRLRGRVVGYSRNGRCVWIERLDTPKHYKNSFYKGFLVIEQGGNPAEIDKH